MPWLWSAATAIVGGDAAAAMGPVAPVDTECGFPGSGAPTCAVGKVPGSAVSTLRAVRHVGNPIEVVSGNKYQQETDFQAFGSGLVFTRHYNSLLADEDLGLGPGWRHAYSVSMERLTGVGVRVTQSDGRRLDFRHVPGTSAPEVHLGADAAAGRVLIGDAGPRWHLGDGRRFDFHGRWLVAMHFDDARGSLALRYEDRRLASVTDSHGRSLRLRYASREESLPRYGSDERWRPIGSIDSLILPDGGVVRYDYDRHRSPVAVRYPDGSRIDYGHDDIDFPTLLTSRRASVDAHERRWSYDGGGLAVSSSGPAGVDIERTIRGPEAGDATLRWHDGRVETLTWDPPTDGAPPDRSSFLGTEAGAAARARARVEAESEAEVATGPAGPVPSREDIATEAVIDALRVDAATGAFHGTAALDGTGVPFSIETNRSGRIERMRWGAIEVERLLGEWAVGALPACDSSASPERPDIVARLAALGTGAAVPCGNDPLLLLGLKSDIEHRGSVDGMHAERGAADIRIIDPQRRPGPHRRPSRGTADRPSDRPHVPVPQKPDPCVMPEDKDCEELARDREMALLSQCAYRGDTCRTGWRSVPPEEVGLTNSDFHLDGFDAELYQDPGTGEYVVAFRGTDGGPGDDWTANFEQGRGATARQYELALQLSRSLSRALPGMSVNYTGHSLGGGLATLAALEARADAAVFNPASLHPNTAHRADLNAEYVAAGASIDVMTTYGDPLTEANRHGQNTGLFGARIAPGAHTMISDPPDWWLDLYSRGLGNPLKLVLKHSMKAVIESIESMLELHCGFNRYAR